MNHVVTQKLLIADAPWSFVTATLMIKLNVISMEATLTGSQLVYDGLNHT